MLLSAALACLAAAAPVQGGPPLPPGHTGKLYLSGQDSNNLGEFLPDGTFLRSFSHPSLVRPRGVAVDDEGRLAVVSQGTGSILVFDLDGALQKTVSHPDLTSGTGLARSPGGDWYVGNFSPGGVLIFDRDWNYLGTLRRAGLDGVNCVSFDPDGSFAVTNAVNSRVHLFSPANKQTGTVSHPSLGSPMSIAMDSAGSHFVSNGSTGVVTKFGPDWAYLLDFGAGILSSPQGIAIDEQDVLTISNYSQDRIHWFDNQGGLLGSAPLAGVRTARNLAWQSSPYALAREGSVDAANGYPGPVLSINGLTGDSMGRVALGRADPFRVDVAASPGGPAPAPYALFAWIGAPALTSVEELPFGSGLLALPSPLAGGRPLTLVNSIGYPSLLGSGRFPAALAPGRAFAFPNGLGFAATITLQGILRDAGSAGTAGYSATNALVVEFQ